MTTYSLLPAQQPLLHLFSPAGQWPIVSRMPHPITLDTTERVLEIEARAAALNLPTRCIGIAKPLGDPVVISGPNSEWVAMRGQHDPNMQQNAGYPMPYDVIETIERMVDGGLDLFDDIAFVHELPKGVRTHKAGRIDVEATRSMFSPEMVERSRRIGAASGSIMRLAALPLLGAALLGLGAAALAAAPVLAAAAVVDPIIFGLVHDDRTGNDAWVYIAHFDAYV